MNIEKLIKDTEYELKKAENNLESAIQDIENVIEFIRMYPGSADKSSLSLGAEAVFVHSSKVYTLKCLLKRLYAEQEAAV